MEMQTVQTTFSYHCIRREFNNTEIVLWLQLFQDRVHGLLSLIQLCTNHRSTGVQHKNHMLRQAWQ